MGIMMNHGRTPMYCVVVLLVVLGLMSLGSVLAQDATAEATPEATAEATQLIPCTVSTSVSKSIAVRVGPGKNRTSFAFLPENQQFDVLGQAEAKDGSQWWKLDKQIVAPKKSATEAWVAQADVQATGDCEPVIDVNAPPIIPITSGANNNQTSSAVNVLPKPGKWTISYPSSMTGLCPNGQDSASMGLDWSPETWDLSISGDSSSINYATRTFSRVSTGVYAGITQLNRLGSNVSARMTLYVRSATQIDVSLAFAYAAKNVACAFTVSAKMTAD